MARIVIDKGRDIDWGKTSADYAQFRPGPPDEFFERLRALGIGTPDQRILDLGTGTGVIARALARRGAAVTGIDVAESQIAQARHLAEAEGDSARFIVASAEDLPFADCSFDAASANQCFLYFDLPRTLTSLRRVLSPGGRLMISHFNWLPRLDPVACASEALVLKYNPSWEGADFDGKVEIVPDWLPDDMQLESFFQYDADVPFDRQSWRGRIRASRGVGASLGAREIEMFDKEHAELLERQAPPTFTVKHRIDARILRFS